MAIPFAEAITGGNNKRFVHVREIRAHEKGLHPAIQERNVDTDLQERVKAEIAKRKEALGGCRVLPPGLLEMARSGWEDQVMRANFQAVAEKLFAFQADVIEAPNRLSDNEFSPTPREQMVPFTDGILPKGDPRAAGGHMLFDSPTDFLKAFKDGLAIWKGKPGDKFGGVGLLDVAGGAGTRAAKELQRYRTYAQTYGVTDKTPRSLYPIPDTVYTFKGVLVNIIRKFSEHLQVRTPIFEMITPEVANEFTEYLKSAPEADQWEKAEIYFWSQRLLSRYDVASDGVPLEGDFPAGHGDNAMLAFRYGIMQAMKDTGIKIAASSNGDEFLWYYMFPAIMAKMSKFNSDMMAVGIPNANNQMGGYFGNGGLIETAKIPLSYVRAGIAPQILNSTFYSMNVDTLLRGAQRLGEDHRPIHIVSKPTWIDVNGKKRFINMLGSDSWMGDEFAHMISAGSGRMTVLEAARNLFLGMKGPQQAADQTPQDFLGGKSYSAFYAMMAYKIYKVLDVLLGNDEAEKRKISEQLYRNNFELINVAI